MENRFTDLEIGEKQLEELGRIRQYQIDRDKRDSSVTPQQHFPKKKTAEKYSDQTTKDLFKELESSQHEHNDKSSVKTLQTLMKRKNVNFKDKRRLLIQFQDLLCSQGKFKIAKENLLHYDDIFNHDDKQTNEYKIFSIVNELYRIKIDMYLGDIWQAYFEFLRQSRVFQSEIVYYKKTEDDLRQANDYTESLADEMLAIKEKIELDFTVKLREMSMINDSINCLYSQGENTGGVLGIGSDNITGPTRQNKPINLPLLRNRIVHSVACGDYHCIVLVSSCGNFDAYRSNQEKARYMQRDVFGWGSNRSGQIDGLPDFCNEYNAPVCISQFVNKNIKQVAAYKTSSACFAENNDYYAWGGSVYDAEIQPQSHVKDKISNIQVGNGFKAILTEVGDLYVWGEVKNSKSERIFESEKPKKIKSSNGVKIKKMSVGYDHILLIDNEKDYLYFFGCNEVGQGAFSEREHESTEIVVSKYLGGEKMYNIWALEKMSIVQTLNSELYYFGQYGFDPVKIAWYPRDFEIDEKGTMPNNVSHCGKNLYMSTANCKIYNWDLKMAHRFKEEPYKDNGHYLEISVGKGFVVLRKPYVNPTGCSIEVDKKNTETDEQITLSILYRDLLSGEFMDKIMTDYKLRVGLAVSERKMSYQEVEALSRDYLEERGHKKIADNSRHNISILYLKNDNLALTELLVTKQGKIKFFQNKPGNYNLYVTINEEVVNETITVQIKESNKFELMMEMKRRKDEFAEGEKAKKVEKRRQNEEFQLQEEMAKKERERTVKERAEENLAKEKKRVFEEKRLEMEQKMMKKDARTGGGFDMSKIKKKDLEQNVDPNVKSSRNLKPGIFNKPVKIKRDLPENSIALQMDAKRLASGRKGHESQDVKQSTGMSFVSGSKATYDQIKSGIYQYFDDEPNSNLVSEMGRTQKTMQTVNLTGKNPQKFSKDLNNFENKQTPRKKVDVFENFDKQYHKESLDSDVMNLTGQSFNSRQSGGKNFKIKIGTQGGGVGRSMGRVSGDNWNKVADPRAMNNLLVSEIDFDAANTGLNKSKSGAFNLGKLKLRSSVHANMANPEKNLEKKEEKARPVHLSLGPVMTKKPIVGGMVSTQMMQDLHNKAKKQIGYKKKGHIL